MAEQKIEHTLILYKLPPKIKRIECYDERRGWGFKEILLRGPIEVQTQATTINRYGTIRLYGPQGF